MVASGLNFLPPAAKAIASAPSAPTSTSTSNAASPSSDHSFARLVEQSSNDSRATARDSVQDRQDTRDATKSTPAATVDTTSTADATPPTPAQLDQPVTPTQAADLLNHFDSLSASLTSAGVDSAGLQDLKNQLQQIAAGETPQSLGDLLAALPVTDTEPTAAALDLSSLFMAPPTPVTRDDNGAAATNQGAEAALADETAPDTADTAETTASAAPVLPVTTAPLAPPQAPTAIRVFHVLNAALEQSSAPVVAQQTPATAQLPLQPTLIHAQSVAAPVKTANADKPAEDAPPVTVIEVTPLAQSLAVPQSHTVTTASTSDTSRPAANDTIAISDLTPRASLDSMIPPLATPEKKPALPDVTLPGTAAIAATPAETAAAAPSTPFVQQLQAASTAAVQPITGMVKANAPAKADEVKPAVPAVAAVSDTFVPGSVMTAQAVAPTSAVAGQVLPGHAGPVIEQVSVAIHQASRDGIDHITIQLSPGDLGRVEVKMHTSTDGQTHLSFLVDKPETFDALSRDARSLERSLQDSGIKADTSGMQFNLRQQPQPQHQSSLGGDGSSKQQADATPVAPVAAPTAATASATKNYRVDVREGIDIHA